MEQFNRIQNAFKQYSKKVKLNPKYVNAMDLDYDVGIYVIEALEKHLSLESFMTEEHEFKQMTRELETEVDLDDDDIAPLTDDENNTLWQITVQIFIDEFNLRNKIERTQTKPLTQEQKERQYALLTQMTAKKLSDVITAHVLHIRRIGYFENEDTIKKHLATLTSDVFSNLHGLNIRDLIQTIVLDKVKKENPLTDKKVSCPECGSEDVKYIGLYEHDIFCRNDYLCKQCDIKFIV